MRISGKRNRSRRSTVKPARSIAAARADLLRRLGRMADAADAYRRALELALIEPERRFVRRRARALATDDTFTRPDG